MTRDDIQTSLEKITTRWVLADLSDNNAWIPDMLPWLTRIHKSAAAAGYEILAQSAFDAIRFAENLKSHPKDSNTQVNFVTFGKYLSDIKLVYGMELGSFEGEYFNRIDTRI